MEQEQIIQEKGIKKKNKFIKKFLIFLIIAATVIISLGLIFPGLLWGKNLGIRYTNADYESILKKLNYTQDEAPVSGTKEDYTYQYGELVNVDEEFTSEEITAFFNENRPSYYALKNVQVKINKDGTIEAVTSANVDYFLNEVLGGKYSRGMIDTYMPALGLLPNNVNLYLKFSGLVINNDAEINLINVTVQGVAIPENIVTSMEAKNTITTGINGIMTKFKENSGGSFEKIAVENEKIILKGKLPSSIERIKK